MKLLYLVLCFATWQWQYTLQQKIIQHRIINGDEVSIKDYPYQVGLYLTFRKQLESQCGGTLISRKHILTAAHCFSLLVVQEIRILMGSNRSIEVLNGGQLTSEEQSQNCKKCWVNHPNYNKPLQKYENDICIVTLPHEVKLSPTVKPISLPKKSDSIHDFVGKTAVVSGWGQTEKGVSSDTLKAVNITMTITINGNCPENALCSIPVNDKSACEGDSGGPAVMDKKIIGIVSYGKNKKDSVSCEKAEYQVYTYVQSYLDWIHNVTGIAIED